MMDGHIDHNMDTDNEIEHWCPVCDRQIIQTCKPAPSAPAPAPPDCAQEQTHGISRLLSESHITPTTPATTSRSATELEVTVNHGQKKRLSTGPGRGSRISLHRNKTANGHPYGKQKGTGTDNHNLLIQDLIIPNPDRDATATKSRTSPHVQSDPITSEHDNAV